MLEKRRYPGLNRAQRRHPAKLIRDMQLSLGSTVNSNWLLAGLMRRAGIVAPTIVGSEGAQV